MATSGMVTLIMRQGPRPNQAFELTKDVYTIGREAGNDITLEDPQISRHHARLTRQGNSYVIEDLGSTNGAFVNGRRVSTPVLLSNGDMLGFADTIVLAVQVQNAVGDATVVKRNAAVASSLPQLQQLVQNTLVDLARLSASAANVQPLKYILSWEPQKNARIFPLLAWAGYLKDWPGPVAGERPAAYIVMLGDKRLRQSFETDQGIAAQSILLGATEKGLGGCIIASIQRRELRELLAIPDTPRSQLSINVTRFIHHTGHKHLSQK